MKNKLYQHLGVKGLQRVAVEYGVGDDIPTAKQLCKRNDTILDLGCGYGRVALPLLKAGFHVDGIDHSREYIRKAKQEAKKLRLPPRRFRVGNMIKLPYASKSYNKVLSFWNSFNDLHFPRDQKKALNEIYRVLKSEGLGFLVLRDGESPEIKKELRERGFGPNKRLLSTPLKGTESVAYIHNRHSLDRLCKRSHFSKWKIVRRNMNCRKRLVLYLFKKSR